MTDTITHAEVLIPSLRAIPALGDLVLEEMSHRWCNALQGLSATLQPCQTAGASLAFIQTRLANIDHQILAMAALHRRLSRSLAQGQSLEGYCRALCMDVLLAFGREEITPSVRMCEVTLSPARVHRLGAIVVELVTNALKHGRAPPDGGIVSVSMTVLDDGRLELLVSDSFPPPAAQPARPRMVEGLVEALRGELNVETEGGYRTCIRFAAF
jgi:two-component sensor histidine kinase